MYRALHVEQNLTVPATTAGSSALYHNKHHHNPTNKKNRYPTASSWKTFHSSSSMVLLSSSSSSSLSSSASRSRGYHHQNYHHRHVPIIGNRPRSGTKDSESSFSSSGFNDNNTNSYPNNFPSSRQNPSSHYIDSQQQQQQSGVQLSDHNKYEKNGSKSLPLPPLPRELAIAVNNDAYKNPVTNHVNQVSRGRGSDDDEDGEDESPGQDFGDSSQLLSTTLRRRSHRPRGCRGGRKNRKNKINAGVATGLATVPDETKNISSGSIPVSSLAAAAHLNDTSATDGGRPEPDSTKNQVVDSDGLPAETSAHTTKFRSTNQHGDGIKHHQPNATKINQDGFADKFGVIRNHDTSKHSRQQTVTKTSQRSSESSGSSSVHQLFTKMSTTCSDSSNNDFHSSPFSIEANEQEPKTKRSMTSLVFSRSQTLERTNKNNDNSYNSNYGPDGKERNISKSPNLISGYPSSSIVRGKKDREKSCDTISNTNDGVPIGFAPFLSQGDDVRHHRPESPIVIPANTKFHSEPKTQQQQQFFPRRTNRYSNHHTHHHNPHNQNNLFHQKPLQYRRTYNQKPNVHETSERTNIGAMYDSSMNRHQQQHSLQEHQQNVCSKNQSSNDVSKVLIPPFSNKNQVIFQFHTIEPYIQDQNTDQSSTGPIIKDNLDSKSDDRRFGHNSRDSRLFLLDDMRNDYNKPKSSDASIHNSFVDEAGLKHSASTHSTNGYLYSNINNNTDGIAVGCKDIRDNVDNSDGKDFKTSKNGLSKVGGDFVSNSIDNAEATYDNNTRQLLFEEGDNTLLVSSALEEKEYFITEEHGPTIELSVLENRWGNFTDKSDSSSHQNRDIRNTIDFRCPSHNYQTVPAPHDPPPFFDQININAFRAIGSCDNSSTSSSSSSSSDNSAELCGEGYFPPPSLPSYGNNFNQQRNIPGVNAPNDYRNQRIIKQRQMMASGGSLFVTSPRSFLFGGAFRKSYHQLDCSN